MLVLLALDWMLKLVLANMVCTITLQAFLQVYSSVLIPHKGKTVPGPGALSSIQFRV